MASRSQALLGNVCRKAPLCVLNPRRGPSRPAFPSRARERGRVIIEARMATVPQKTSPTTHPAPGARPKPKPQPRDSAREVVETIVFVVALVLMLKLFVVEAFVIPTGSMAETLLGYNKVVTCEECGHTFPVNATDEADPQHGERKEIVGARCPNCFHEWQWAKDP